MALDPYQLCPCGGGKKIKFCCSKDIVPEIEKLLRAIEGEQRVAALDQANKLIEAKGERLSLLAMKADLLLSLEQEEQARATIKSFLEKAPYNPVALALSAIAEVSEGKLEGAIEMLQRSLEYIEDTMPPSVYGALGLLAQALMVGGDVLAARGHLLAQAGLSGGQDQRPMEMLARINMMSEIPLLLKQDHSYAACPDDVPWKGEFNAAMKSAHRAAWLAACESLGSLSEKVSQQPSILKNIAIMRGCLGDRDATVKAWRDYASLDGVDREDAVEAEALAQMLDPASTADEIDSVTVSYAIPDTESLMEVLISEQRVSQMPVDPAELATDDEPPPKGTFWLLDRAVPSSSEGLTRETVPNVMGEVFVYGKQTDRDARLEFSLLRDDGFDEAKTALADVLGEKLGDATGEEVIGGVGKVSAALTWRWRLPNDVTPDRRAALVEEQRKDVMLNAWPELTLAVLGGKTPREAAKADATSQIKTQAAILLLELAGEQRAGAFDFNELRSELGLPTSEAIDPTEVDTVVFPLPRVPRIEVEKLSNDDLVELYRRVVFSNAPTAIQHVAEEAVKRDSLDEQLDKSEAYELLVRTAGGTAKALDYIAQAKESAKANGDSPARWLLMELPVRMQRQEPQECQRIVDAIRTRHMEEPGVAQALYEMLVSFGIISPDGAPAGPPPGDAAAPVAAEAGTSSKLWTPDSGEPASGQQGEKSKLWVPGMD